VEHTREYALVQIEYLVAQRHWPKDISCPEQCINIDYATFNWKH